MMKENVLQLNGGITTNVDKKYKNCLVCEIFCIIFGIMLHVVAKVENV